MKNHLKSRINVLKQLNKFDNIEHIDDNYIEILKYQ